MTATKKTLYEFRSRRIKRSFAYEKRKITSPVDIANILLHLTKDMDREHFFAFYLSTAGALIGFEIVSVGGMASVEVHPRELFRGAMMAGAFAIVIAHNHPSGSPTPSQDDMALTKRMVSAGELLGIEVIDHVIAAADGCYSFAEQGQL